MLSKIRYLRPVKILDLACGTGLVTFGLARSIGAESMIVGLDSSRSMLRVAMKKKHAERGLSCLELICATGEYLPFRNETLDCVTVGLALRNFGDKSAVFSEAHRTLIGSGWFLSVDFVLPDSPLLRRLYMFHVFNILPTLGRLVSASWHRTLVYLARSIQFSVPPDEICRALAEQDFRLTFTEKITLGIVALIGGRKQPTALSEG